MPRVTWLRVLHRGRWQLVVPGVSTVLLSRKSLERIKLSRRFFSSLGATRMSLYRKYDWSCGWLMLLLARLINRQVVVFRSFSRRSPWLFYCLCDRFRRAVKKVVCVMRRITTVVAMVARCRADSVHVLTKDSAVTGALLFQCCSCLFWQCLFGCSNGRRSAIRRFWWAAFNGNSDRIMVVVVVGW